MRKLVFLAGLLIAQSSVAAWTELDFGTSSTNFFVDFDTLQRKNNIVRVWTKHEYKIPLATNVNPNEFKLSENFYTEFDCQEKKYRALSSNTFSENQLKGKLISANSTPNSWTFVPPDTIANLMLSRVCKFK
jgi:hypothetical protein